MHVPTALLLEAAPRSILSEDMSIGVVITELLLALLLIVVMFLVPIRSLKILCACGAEVCLFLACRMAFGPHAIITQVMCWLTAAVACIITVFLVNRINWSNLRGRPGK